MNVDKTIDDVKRQALTGVRADVRKMFEERKELFGFENGVREVNTSEQMKLEIQTAHAQIATLTKMLEESQEVNKKLIKQCMEQEETITKLMNHVEAKGPVSSFSRESKDWLIQRAVERDMAEERHTARTELRDRLERTVIRNAELITEALLQAGKPVDVFSTYQLAEAMLVAGECYRINGLGPVQGAPI